MKKYHYLVLGTGMGSAIAWLLANYDDTERVFLGDISYDNAKRAVLNLSLPEKVKSKMRAREISVNADIGVYTFFRNFDVIISAIPAKYSTKLAEMAIGAGVHFCDLGGVIEVTQKMLKLNQDAIKNGSSIVTDMGIMPGDGTMMGKLIIADFEQVQELSIGAGGNPQNPIAPTFHQKTFALEGMEHIYYDNPIIVKNGQIEVAEPFSGYRSFKIKELARYAFDGKIVGFNTAGASVSPWDFCNNLGVKKFQELTFRWEPAVDFVKNIPRSEFQATMSKLLTPPSKLDPDFLWMEVNAFGTDKKGREMEKTWTLLDEYDQTTGFSAMQRTTGFSTAIFARMMALGATKPGVNTADNAITPIQMAYLLNELETTCGMKIKKTTTLY